MLKFWKIALCAAAAAPLSLMAGPLNRGWVPAEAKWVVHLDVEAGVNSSLGRLAMENRHAWRWDERDKVKARTGIDLVTDIKSLTVYGECGGDAEAVAIITATSATDSFLEKLRAEEKTFQRVSAGKHEIDTWQEHGSARYGFVRKLGDQRLILVSQDKDRLVRAIELTEDEGKGGESVVGDGPRQGSVLFVAAGNVGSVTKNAKAVFVQKMQDLRLDLGESEGRIFGEMLVTAGNEQDAADLRRMMEGAVAMGRMIASGEAEMAPLVDISQKLAFETQGTSVRATVSIDVAEAVEGLRQALREKAEPGEQAPAPSKAQGGAGR